MKGYLQKLARSVLRPQPNPHPFVESIYPSQEAAGKHFGQSPEIVAGTTRSQSAAAQLLDGPFAAGAHRHVGVPAWPHEEVSSARDAENQASAYRPLLPSREPHVSIPSELISSLRRSTEADSPEPRLPGGDSEAGTARAAVSARSSREELRPAPAVLPALPPFDVRALLSARKMAAAPALPAPYVQHERKADDIQIHIGRIEVIAATPAPIRQATPPARKGTSLDEYLGSRNGRVG